MNELAFLEFATMAYNTWGVLERRLLSEEKEKRPIFFGLRRADFKEGGRSLPCF